ncbi:MAG: right-handed parallel beta-helix repeat-containing protein [Planctomycetaceae bacterium]|nr:right-handed parallel beta-helix repeat-containing protein [Planctomycetaceae bacterium]
MLYRRLLLILLLACLCTVSVPVSAGIVYVDSRLGNDAFDGRTAQPSNQWTGPVKTLQRAASRLHVGDSIVLADNGAPYFGSLSLVNRRHSGTAGQPLEIVGNGAVISGALPIPREAWVNVGLDLWRITPIRKHYVQLSRGNDTLPSFDLPWSLQYLPNAPADHWYQEGHSIYFKTEPGGHPAMQPIDLARENVGLTLLGVEHVVIRDVTFRHFRLDGINVHDRCHHIVLDNVVCESNGRAGVAVGGTSQVSIRNSLLSDNREHSLLITELGQAEVSDSEMMREPTIVE